jgi:hypothetical protein
MLGQVLKKVWVSSNRNKVLTLGKSSWVGLAILGEGKAQYAIAECVHLRQGFGGQGLRNVESFDGTQIKTEGNVGSKTTCI